MGSKIKHRGKPQGMSYADKLARDRMLREAAQKAANDATVQVKADIHAQKMSWLFMRALNKGFGFGKKSFAKLAVFIRESTEWYEDLVAGADEEYANEKLRQDIERATHEEVEFAWEEEIQAAKKKHEADRLTNYERLRYSKPEKMAETLCNWIDCQTCPGKDLCNHKDGKANGLVKWLKQQEEKA